MEANINYYDVIVSHRFLYMAQQLLYRNANYIFMRFPQLDLDRPTYTPNDMIPEDISKNSIKGKIVEKVTQTDEDKLNFLRELGKVLPDDIQKVQETTETRIDWEPAGKAIEFCQTLLPLSGPPGQSNAALLRTRLESDPSKRVEKHRNTWLMTRTDILNRQQLREQTDDAVTKEKLTAEISSLGQKLWCSKYQMDSATVAMEQSTIERNLELSRCFICVRVSEGWSQDSTCAFFPEEAVEADAAPQPSEFRFRDSGRVDRRNMSDADLLFGNSTESAMPSLWGGMSDEQLLFGASASGMSDEQLLFGATASSNRTLSELLFTPEVPHTANATGAIYRALRDRLLGGTSEYGA